LAEPDVRAGIGLFAPWHNRNRDGGAMPGCGATFTLCKSGLITDQIAIFQHPIMSDDLTSRT